MDAQSAKAQLRRRLRQQRARLGAGARAHAAARIAAAALALPALRAAGWVALYAPRAGEVDTAALFAALRGRGAGVCYPRARPATRHLEFVPVGALSELRPGFAGIAEPAGAARPVAAIDVVVLPCVGVDPAGHRLGSGHGYYDRSLVDYRGACIGLAFAVQRVAALPQEAWDRGLDAIVCEDGARACRAEGPP